MISQHAINSVFCRYGINTTVPWQPPPPPLPPHNSRKAKRPAFHAYYSPVEAFSSIVFLVKPQVNCCSLCHIYHTLWLVRSLLSYLLPLAPPSVAATSDCGVLGGWMDGWMDEWMDRLFDYYSPASADWPFAITCRLAESPGTNIKIPGKEPEKKPQNLNNCTYLI